MNAIYIYQRELKFAWGKMVPTPLIKRERKREREGENERERKGERK